MCPAACRAVTYRSAVLDTMYPVAAFPGRILTDGNHQRGGNKAIQIGNRGGQQLLGGGVAEEMPDKRHICSTSLPTISSSA